jgi:hypothetical protein
LRFHAALRRPDGFAPRWELYNQTLADLKAQNLVDAHFHFLDDYRLGGHLQYLHRILDWAAEHRVAVVLIDMPVAADLEMQYGPAFATYRTALADLERRREVRVLRATRETVGLDDTFFADRIHLNASGRVRLGAWVRAQLADLGCACQECTHARQ